MCRIVPSSSGVPLSLPDAVVEPQRKLFTSPKACLVQVWNKGIHIPDLPAWALVAGGLGAGGLYYYYKYHIRPTHAHAPALIGAQACMHAWP